jgi:hypothetical protein
MGNAKAQFKTRKLMVNKTSQRPMLSVNLYDYSINSLKLIASPLDAD